MTMQEIFNGTLRFTSNGEFILYLDENNHGELIGFIVSKLKEDNIGIDDIIGIEFQFNENILSGNLKMTEINGLLFFHDRYWYGWQEIDDALISYIEVEISKKITYLNTARTRILLEIKGDKYGI